MIIIITIAKFGIFELYISKTPHNSIYRGNGSFSHIRFVFKNIIRFYCHIDFETRYGGRPEIWQTTYETNGTLYTLKIYFI